MANSAALAVQWLAELNRVELSGSGVPGAETASTLVLPERRAAYRPIVQAHCFRSSPPLGFAA